MFGKILTFCVVLLSLTNAYDEEGNVLVLHNNDFPQVLEDFPHILIEFYAPWCGHCQHLAPVYIQVADELKALNMDIKLAKVDCTVETEAGQTYKVQGYPTLIYFNQGQQIPYNGGRTKDQMLNWLKKKVSDPTTEITAQQYEKLSTNGKVSIVYHGDIKSDQGKIVANLALGDDYNTYYHSSSLGKAEGSVEIIRPFGDSETYEKPDQNLQEWITKYERPLVLPFDQRTIGSIFQERQQAAILINTPESTDLSGTFAAAATTFQSISKKSLIFSEVQKNGQMFNELVDYVKINQDTHFVVLISTSDQVKFVLNANGDGSLTQEQIVEFLSNWENGKAQSYGINEEITEKPEQEKSEQEKSEQEKSEQENAKTDDEL